VVVTAKRIFVSADARDGGRYSGAHGYFCSLAVINVAAIYCLGIFIHWRDCDGPYYSFAIMTVVFFFGILIILAGFGLLFLVNRQQQQLGSLTGDLVYTDNETTPGLVLEAKTIPLRGKPDAIRKEQNVYIPVEIKTGKTPNEPYLNHTMQLMAYCLLVDEHYAVRPPGGIIKYPEKEFKVAYTKEAEDALRSLVKEIVRAKADGKEFQCTHPAHHITA
jgi:CRISPR-associated exonuclease Cas4